ncbi:N-ACETYLGLUCOSAMINYL-PH OSPHATIDYLINOSITOL DE-N-ACETYLASE, putative [Babesia bigemina]|uniref:N-acetylglucosaminylphosphatidylinositol deacetylase n=1 Tax=Babesia bigemina TaxID=5866 RepID=A0A061DE40_BABBI|nr:N-ACETYLGLUCOSAMINYL-PH OSPHATIDYLINOSITOL DE-N-ACETYLASE, putative [Babesia bigemina]CDR96795.1 N-ACETYLGLUCOSAMINYL-PH OSPHATIDYLINOSITOL DE-N-ACETYLASE, putative [Babesia bigemina]|eukprot:XP_012768981.1 N-ACETYLGLUCOSAMINYL-PH OSPHATIDYLINOSITOL DE-N-ACETYLASE, putative [Babesia bigemina]
MVPHIILGGIAGCLFAYYSCRVVGFQGNRMVVDSLMKNVKYDGEATVAFVISYPGDESRFFTPLMELLRLRANDPEKRFKLAVLTLVPGELGVSTITCAAAKYNPDALQRIIEMQGVCRKYNMICLLEHHPLEGDEATNFWKPSVVADRIVDFLEENKARHLFTFDKFGMDGDRARIAVHQGVMELTSKMPSCHIWLLHSYSKVYNALPLLATMKAAFGGGYRVVLYSPFEVTKNMRIHRSQWLWDTTFWAFWSPYSYSNIYERLDSDDASSYVYVSE